MSWAMLRNSWAAGEMWLAMVRAPLDHGDGRDQMCVSCNQRAFRVREGGSWLDRCGAPGADRPSHGLGRHPGGAKAAGLQRMLWPGRPRKGTVGRPRLQERQGTRDRYDTMPARHCLTLSGLVAIGSGQGDGSATAM